MNQFSSVDHQHMSLALQLAEKGRCTTSPNPKVGCVIVDSAGEIVGKGYHKQAGGSHAEVFALRDAGEKARGAAAYVTLEPCSHHGRTPPCANALIEAGVSKVIAAMVDPNPMVAGRGLKRLQDAGIATAHGLLGEKAEHLNRGFIKRMRTGMPWVTVKLASSLDGKTALANGVSQWITSPQARADVQAHRASSCAILTGSGTVLADNPSMNVRFAEIPSDLLSVPADLQRQPLRIVLDGRNQLTGSYRLFEIAGESVVINRLPNTTLPANVRQIQVANHGNKLDLQEVMKVIAELGVNDLWVEAGGMLAGALLENNLLDELILYQAPKLLGDQGQNLFVMTEKTQMSQANLLSWQDIRQVGPDLKLTARFVQPQ
jgi:diaminohydroxyphosphoribosylaminopyrimidine deaminase/5-amino-6-(5-phosphoribosylamino)uracil reductase